VAKLILEKGNKLLIVSKPRLECIENILYAFDRWKDQILFRFTIGTINDEVSRFWEPGAPLPGERIACLYMAFDSGFQTSVSIEPMLSGIFGAEDVFHVVGKYVTETVWIGKMNKALLRVDSTHEEAVRNVLEMQRDEEIIKLVDDLKAYPQIRWKDSIKMVVANHKEKPE
jgi:DNA repair photolyase